MGVVPLQFKPGDSAQKLGLTGTEIYSIFIDDAARPGQDIPVEIEDTSGRRTKIMVTCRLDTPTEIGYYRNGGILQTVLGRFLLS
jgi:aconitate hydratase